MRNQAIAERLNAEKEIDSVDFINAVCKLTGKSFSYYKRVEIYSDEEEVAHWGEDRPEYGKHPTGEASHYWKQKYRAAQAQINLLEENIKAKNELIEQLKVNLDLKKGK